MPSPGLPRPRLIDPGSSPGKTGSLARGVRHQPKPAFDFVGNRRSACTEMAVRFRPSYTFSDLKQDGPKANGCGDTAAETAS